LGLVTAILFRISCWGKKVEMSFTGSLSNCYWIRLSRVF